VAQGSGKVVRLNQTFPEINMSSLTMNPTRNKSSARENCGVCALQQEGVRKTLIQDDRDQNAINHT
jgi:hypothetical protein